MGRDQQNAQPPKGLRAFDPSTRPPVGASECSKRRTSDNASTYTVTVVASSKTLWHYTDVTGFRGIIHSHHLRLGDARFLNDRTEREYGVSIIKHLIAHELQQGQDHFLALTAHYLMKPDAHTIHLCSFSEVPSSLSQWQRYGADGYGYCLGFAATALRRIQTPDLQLKRVIYKPAQQLKLARVRLQTLREAFRLALQNRNDPPPPELLLGTSSALAAIVLESIAMEFKDPSFSDEREWRLIHRALTREKLTTISGGLDFTPRGYVVKPYIHVELPRSPKKRSPLTHVICGPRLDGSLATATASYFLAATGCDAEASWSELHKIWR